jgi:O-antigen ligase
MLVSELISYGMLFGIMPWSLTLGDIKFYATKAIGDPSPFLNHIHYGVLLAFVVMLLGQRIVYSDTSKIMKVFMSLFVLSATTNIFITGGRTGYITFLLLLFVLGISYLKKYFVGLILIGILVFGSAYNFSPIFKARVIQTEKSIVQLFEDEANYNSSIGVRVGIFHYASQILKENFLFGVGSGDSMDEIKKITPKKWTNIHSQPHEHNQFLSVFVKLGIVGLLIFLNVYYQIFRYKQEDKELHFVMIVSSLAIAFGVLTTQFNLRVFLPLWAVMLSVSMINRQRETIKHIKLDDKTQLLQIVSVGALFSMASLLKQLF